jgi:hypothetical protein
LGQSPLAGIEVLIVLEIQAAELDAKQSGGSWPA